MKIASSSSTTKLAAPEIALNIELTSIMEPVLDNFALVEKWLESNLIDDSPFIAELLSQIFRVGGKRIRPLLVLLTSHASLPSEREFSRLHIILAVLTELIHAASLVHDDVIDKAALRRGQETINRRWDDRTAVLMGDLLFAQASICLSRIMNPVIVGIYGQVLGDLCAGEIRQMKQHFVTTVNWDDYIRKSIAKTASLFAAGSHSGAILNDAPREIIQALQDFGLNLGICFQIIDDLLDVIGTREKLGKEPGGDLRSGLLTAPALFALETGNQSSARLAALVQTREICSSAGCTEALSLIENNGGNEAAYKLAAQYAKRAKISLLHLPKSIFQESLEQLVDYVLMRVN